MFSSLLKIRLINLNQIVTIFGQGFVSGCNHPLVETIKEYNNNPQIKYSETKLYNFHKNFTPSSTNEALGVKSKIILPLFKYPWGYFRLNARKKNQITSSFCGPSSDRLISKEFNKIISLYNNIKDYGYKTIAKKSIIGGTFLVKNNGKKKFVVLQGNHRISVLSALGRKKVLVYTMKGYHQYIEESSMENLSKLNNVNCPKDVSREIFNSFFKKDALLY